LIDNNDRDGSMNKFQEVDIELHMNPNESGVTVPRYIVWFGKDPPSGKRREDRAIREMDPDTPALSA
jgi:hypothetical protein